MTQEQTWRGKAECV